MCKIIQPLNVALAIAVTHDLPEGIHISASKRGLKMQGDFDDPGRFARSLDLTRDESQDHFMAARNGVPAYQFRIWHGVVQNIFVELVDAQPIETEEVAS